jgi:hypothetical protein
MENFLNIVLKLTVRTPQDSSPNLMFNQQLFAGQYLWSGGHFAFCWSSQGI